MWKLSHVERHIQTNLKSILLIPWCHLNLVLTHSVYLDMLSESLHLHLAINKCSALTSACCSDFRLIEFQYANHVGRAYNVGSSTKVAHRQVAGSNMAVWGQHIFLFRQASFRQGCLGWWEEVDLGDFSTCRGEACLQIKALAPIPFLWAMSKGHRWTDGGAGVMLNKGGVKILTLCNCMPNVMVGVSKMLKIQWATESGIP